MLAKGYMETIWKHQSGPGKESATMKYEEIIKTFEVIKKSGELVFEHYKARGFKNSLIEVGIQNIIGTCNTALEQIAKERGEGKGGTYAIPRHEPEHEPIQV